MNVSSESRLMLRELKSRYSVQIYRVAKRCPACGTKNIYRTPEGVCRACVQKGEGRC